MMLLQIAAGAHPLSGTVAEWVWLLPILPFLGFLINGGISLFSAAHVGPSDPDMGHGHEDSHADAHADAHAISEAEDHGAHGDDHHAVKPHRYAGIVSIIGPLVLAASFVLAFAIFSAPASVR
jgi:hypothetical protein